MKNLKRIIVLLLALSLAFCLFACEKDDPPVCQHTDEDEDGVCDLCEAVLEDPSDGEGITLIEDEEILFQIVLGSDITSSVRMVLDDIVDMLDEFGIELSVVNDSDDPDEWDLEVLVGKVTSRGDDYYFDAHSLGHEGYAVMPIDETKILVAGGSEEMLANAFTLFIEEYLGFTDDMEYIEDVTVYEDDWTEVKTEGYRIEDVTVGGNSIEGYVIARNRAVAVTDEIAKKLQTFLYEKAGYWLDIVNLDDPQGNAIYIESVEKGKAGSKGFRTRLDGDDLIIECAHGNKFESAFNEYYNKTFVGARDVIDLGKYDAITDITCLYYSDFGVVGDGRTDDSEAIRRAHNEANNNNQTVYGEAGKTYYIGKVETPISIMTDTDWRGAKFIFDASDFTVEDSGNVFSIDTPFYPTNFYTDGDKVLKAINANVDENGLVIRGINHGDEQTTKLDVGINTPAMLKVYNGDARVYIRWGYVDTKGSSQCEVVLIDEEGNIDPSTPFLLDYEKVTKIIAIRTDVPQITVKNATIVSRASRDNLLGGYESIQHSIEVNRPNTVIQKLEHVIEGEIAKNAPARLDPVSGLWEEVTNEGFTIKDGVVYQNGKKYTGTDVIKPFTGYSYSGFIQVSNTHNIHIKECIFQARVYYKEGTYDISASYSNKIVFEDCTQSNFFDERPEYCKYGTGSTVPNMSLCWGISGTNYCKNMDYINCVLTRYDAHCGVFNGKIIGGKLAVLRLIGGGTFTLDGVEFYARSGAPLQLREDYGATFNGTLIVKNVNFKYCWYSQFGHYKYDISLIDAPTANVDNGYPTFFPNVIIDGITVETTSTVINILTPGGQTYSQEKDHYPARSPVKEDVHDPDALFTVYYETADPNIVKNKPELFPYLQDKKEGKDYEIVNNGDKTYTLIAKKIPNLQPYHPPEFIKIINMAGKNNLDGKQLTFTLYECNFFKNTDIQVEDGVKLERIRVPK